MTWKILTAVFLICFSVSAKSDDVVYAPQFSRITTIDSVFIGRSHQIEDSLIVLYKYDNSVKEILRSRVTRIERVNENPCNCHELSSLKDIRQSDLTTNQKERLDTLQEWCSKYEEIYGPDKHVVGKVFLSIGVLAIIAVVCILIYGSAMNPGR